MPETNDLVRAELPDGTHVNVGRSFAESHDLTVLDESPLNGAGRFKRTETAAEVEETSPPAGNASRDEWAAYAVGTGRVTDDEIAELGRDELRDTFGG